MSERIPLNQLRSYFLKKHHLAPHAKAACVQQAISSLVGLHAARISTPFVSLFTRIEGFQPIDLEQQMRSSLIKLRCMRKTLHIVPIQVAPIVHQATLKQRLPICTRSYKKIGVNERDIALCKEYLIELVRLKPYSAEDMIHNILEQPFFERIKKQLSNPIYLLRRIIKHCWEEGTFCYINDSSQWTKESRTYGYTPNIYPELNLSSVEKEEAEEKLIDLYIKHYGPVSFKDICWWTGLDKRVVQKHLSAKGYQKILIDSFGSELYITKENAEELILTKPFDYPFFSICAYDDPTLKGYYESRWRYADQKAKEVFLKNGEISSCILLNGRIIGKWLWRKEDKRVEYKIFEQVETQLVNKIDEQLMRLEAFWRKG
ncbi:DNA glycosylase AlkZ-like family protein [Lihuaxuella thermophila]|uniref:Winged helix DNA-binding domain-containing protein n=1 Tax=Lihuaxuella thermophila TaxID=1173111 RepID=A0A1H8CK86_9BACL|nr:crosslink repair DNA glycosylase YcaQ family protein [Lihuaxuella thermophila]SEM94688.1 Winged helix DNA-binding domain-containing protein [Lihuaxuella thermophila]